MRNIARALKHQRLRKAYSNGCSFKIVQTGRYLYEIRVQSGERIESWGSMEGDAVALLPLTSIMWGFVKNLRDAGVSVEVSPDYESLTGKEVS